MAGRMADTAAVVVMLLEAEVDIPRAGAADTRAEAVVDIPVAEAGAIRQAGIANARGVRSAVSAWSSLM